ncbi:hypothetical protein [Humisphaera borealis]|uniref:Uncharacterized protein n=1 Tax=Humisphaera borealis TaxID=2807512 RepID=A0A7M2WUH0_9BACT|nr:hypothetical protein [Humisphaera borealis]QOV88441.1 hypothetical protein IPV69_19625 [Humisphaera borealis]
MSAMTLIHGASLGFNMSRLLLIERLIADGSATEAERSELCVALLQIAFNGVAKR